jgi:biotin carboxylase
MHIVFVDTNVVGLKALRAAKRRGHTVTFVCSRAFSQIIGGADAARGPDLSDEVVEIESSLDDGELLDAVLRIHAGRPVDRLITVLEPCAHMVASLARRLGLVGPDPEAVALAQDKAACRARIAADGIASVPFAVVTDAAAAKAAAPRLGYPMIAKPKRGSASLRARKILRAEDLDEYFSTLDAPLSVASGVVAAMSSETILESYVEGPLFSAEVAAGGGEVVPLMLSWRKRCIADPSIELGTVMPAPVDADATRSMLDYAVDVVRSLGLDLGIFHIELIFGPDGPVLVEVNPRIMGGNIPTVFHLCTDVDAFDLLLDLYVENAMPDACRRVAPRRGAATRSVGPSVAGRITPTLPAGWDAPFRSELAATSFVPSPGMPLEPMTSTYWSRHFQLVRPGPVEASLMAEWVISVTAEATKLELRQSSEDYLLVPARGPGA